MRWADEDSGGAAGQANALESSQVDAGAPVAPPMQTDAPKAQEADWKKAVAAQGVDPGWVVALRGTLVNSGKVSMEDIQPDALADPEHRKWLNRQMRKAKEEEAASSEQRAVATPNTAMPSAKPVEAASGAAAAPSMTAAGQKPVPSVLKPGHMPTSALWQSTATPAAGGGWIPAQNGLWWPPFPVTGGPIAKPLVTTASRQADALDTMTGQARPEQTGG